MYYLGAMINPLVPPAVDPNPSREIPSIKPAYMDAPNIPNNPRKLPNQYSKSDTAHENSDGRIITASPLNHVQGAALSASNLEEESRKRDRDDESSTASVTVLDSTTDTPTATAFSIHRNR